MKVNLTYDKSITMDQSAIRHDTDYIYICDSNDSDCMITIRKKDGLITAEETGETYYSEANILEHGKLTLEW